MRYCSVSCLARGPNPSRFKTTSIVRIAVAPTTNAAYGRQSASPSIVLGSSNQVKTKSSWPTNLLDHLNKSDVSWAAIVIAEECLFQN